MTPLKEYRRARGMTQEAFAKFLGVEQATVSRLETGAGKPSLPLAIRISKATEGAVPLEVWAESKEAAPQ